jgi:NAD(P)-dependent dehydrogenase (short-subunit alcohol dehydrogenase family)
VQPRRAFRWAGWATPRRSPPRVLRLCSDAASYVTGAALPVDAGHTAQ